MARSSNSRRDFLPPRKQVCTCTIPDDEFNIEERYFVLCNLCWGSFCFTHKQIDNNTEARREPHSAVHVNILTVVLVCLWFFALVDHSCLCHWRLNVIHVACSVFVCLFLVFWSSSCRLIFEASCRWGSTRYKVFVVVSSVPVTWFSRHVHSHSVSAQLNREDTLTKENAALKVYELVFILGACL
jgi:hypothetical protein